MSTELLRRTPDVSFSVFKFLKDQSYTVEGVTATLTTRPEFSGLRIRLGYPSDLVKVTTPALHVGSPDEEMEGQVYFGTVDGEDFYTVRVYGFVVGLGDADQPHVFYRDRLKNDVRQLFAEVGEDEGITLYSAATKAELGAIEVINTRSRLIPATAPAVPADRFKFVVEADIAYD